MSKAFSSNLILGQIIVSNLTNVPHKLNYAALHETTIKKTNIKYNNYSGLPFEMQLLKAIK